MMEQLDRAVVALETVAEQLTRIANALELANIARPAGNVTSWPVQVTPVKPTIDYGGGSSS